MNRLDRALRRPLTVAEPPVSPELQFLILTLCPSSFKLGGERKTEILSAIFLVVFRFHFTVMKMMLITVECVTLDDYLLCFTTSSLYSVYFENMHHSI